MNKLRELAIYLISISLFFSCTTSFASCTSVAECSQRAAESAAASVAIAKTMVPEGAVMAFNLKECPTGWKLLDAAAGRFIMGVNKENPLYSTGGVEKIADSGNHSHVARRVHTQHNRFGNDNKDDWWHTSKDGNHNHGGENRPPYISLLFCEKF